MTTRDTTSNKVSAILAFAVSVQLLVNCTVATRSNGKDFDESRNIAASSASPEPSADLTLSNFEPHDFNNFTFYWIPQKYRAFFGKRDKITLSNGLIVKDFHDEADEYDVSIETYQLDLIGMRKSEAWVSLSILLPNRAMPTCLFLYDFADKQHPRLIWKIESGESDVKGFKSIYAEAGKLVVEEFRVEDSPICCPKSYFKSIYRREHDGFRIESRDLLPYKERSRPF